MVHAILFMCGASVCVCVCVENVRTLRTAPPSPTRHIVICGNRCARGCRNVLLIFNSFNFESQTNYFVFHGYIHTHTHTHKHMRVALARCYLSVGIYRAVDMFSPVAIYLSPILTHKSYFERS